MKTRTTGKNNKSYYAFVKLNSNETLKMLSFYLSLSVFSIHKTKKR